MDAYLAGRPSTYTRRTGDPLVSYSNVQAGWYAQDDIRLAKSLSLSVGLRQELQTHIDDRFNLAPRAGVTWSPFKSGATTFRAGAGIFYDWYDAQTYEQTLRVDGVHQVDRAILNPGYPDPSTGGSPVVLPSGRIVQSPDIVQPTLARTNVGVEQALGKYGRVNVLYGYGRSRTALRGHDINAPLADGNRPDPSSGTVTQVESTARSAMHMVHTGFNLNLPWHRTFLFFNYTLGHAMNESDGPFSLPADNLDLRAEWGPTPYDARHRASAMFNMNLWKGFKLATMVNSSSGLPYNITTGFDDNHDTVSNDRPAGVARNSARGDGRWDVGGRLSWGFGFGQRRDSGRRNTHDHDPHDRRPGRRRTDGRLHRRIGRQAVAGGTLSRRHEPVQPREPGRLQRRAHVPVLRSADVFGGAEEAGVGDEIRVLVSSEGLRPSDSPTRALARRFAGALRSRGSLTVVRSHRETSGRFMRRLLLRSEGRRTRRRSQTEERSQRRPNGEERSRTPLRRQSAARAPGVDGAGVRAPAWNRERGTTKNAFAIPHRHSHSAALRAARAADSS